MTHGKGSAILIVAFVMLLAGRDAQWSVRWLRPRPRPRPRW